MSALLRGSLLSALALAVVAMVLRLLPGTLFGVGPLEFTPSTSVLAVASLIGLVALAAGARPVSASLETFLAEVERRPARFEGIVGVLIVLGALLRFAHLNEYPLNGDEHLFVNSAHADGVGGVWAGVLQHHHPPANFYLLHFMQKVSVNPLWLRLPSLVAGLYLIWISARLALAWAGPREALIVAFFVAFAPPFVELSRVCRNYTPALALMVTALLFLVRYARDRRSRDLVLFSLFEGLALLWLYSVAVTLFAANVVAFVAMLVDRRRPVDAFRLFVLQLPVALLLLLLYMVHIRVVGSTEMSAHSLLYHEEDIFRRPLDYLRYLPLPATILAQYLFAGIAGLLAIALAIPGALRLWRSAGPTVPAVALLALALAYLLRFARLLPFDGNRQSTFVAPLILILVAAGLSSLLASFADLRRTDGAAGEGPTRIPRYRPAGLWASAAFLLLFLNLSLGVAEGTVFLDRQEELPATWSDLEHTVSLLRRSAGPDDLVLVSYQGLCAYQAYFNRSAMAYAPGHPATLEAGGLRFHYSPESGWYFTPESIVRSYLEARRTSFPEPVDGLWIARGTGWPWEKPVRDWFHHDFPEVRIDDRIVIESRGWLLRAVAADLDPLGPLVADLKDFYREDFIRSQISSENRREPDYFLSQSGRD